MEMNIKDFKDVLNGSLESRYQTMKSTRDMVLARAQKMSMYTIPSLFPSDVNTSDEMKLHTTYQSSTARYVNTLAGSLLLTLFPPQGRFFALDPDDVNIKDIQEIRKKLFKEEDAVHSYFRNQMANSSLYEALRQLIIGGNTCLYTEDDGSTSVIPLWQYTVSRDCRGNIIMAVIEETMSVRMLDQETRDLLTTDVFTGDKKTLETDSVKLYTGIERVNKDKVKIWQEINDIVVTEETIVLERESPYIFPVLILLPNASYGRAFAEDYYGDAYTVEEFSRVLNKIITISSMTVGLCRNSKLARDLADSKKDIPFETGESDDLAFISPNKTQDMRALLEHITNTKRELGMSYADKISIQRSGERVTAEEIKRLALALENALGGIYSKLSATLQLPMIHTVFRIMRKKGLVTGITTVLDKAGVSLKIVGGYEVLGKGHNAERLMTFGSFIANNPKWNQRLKDGTFLDALSRAMQLDEGDLLKSDEDIQQEMQAAQANEVAGNLAPVIAKEAMQDGNTERQ